MSEIKPNNTRAQDLPLAIFAVVQGFGVEDRLNALCVSIALNIVALVPPQDHARALAMVDHMLRKATRDIRKTLGDPGTMQ